MLCFGNSSAQSLWKDIKGFSKSTARTVKEGFKIMKEDPQKTANKIMNDQEYQKKLEKISNDQMESSEKMNKHFENAEKYVQRAKGVITGINKKQKIQKKSNFPSSKRYGIYYGNKR